jgi:hypothetical protein
MEMHGETVKIKNTLSSSKLLSQNTEVKFHKTLVWLILSYGAEARPMTSEVINVLRVFGRKMVRKMYGPIKKNKKK